MREFGSVLKSRIIKLDWFLILILIIYIFVGLSLLSYYQYQINPDGISYITITNEYLTGNFFGAVNAYSGPLISWFLTPFLLFNQSPAYALLSTKILSLIVGFFTIIGVRQLSYIFELGKIIRSTILLCSIPIILYFALTVITPDLLVVCFLVYYFTIIFNPKYSNKLYNGVLCGVLGALAFFAKSFIFPFFIVHFIIMNVLHYYESPEPKKRNKKVSKNLIIGFLTFLVISGVWVGLISSKEGKLTFGTSGEYNYELVGPQSNGFPQYSQGLSAPGNTQKLESWSPFSSWSNFKYQLKLIKNNSISTLYIFQYFSFLSVLILLFFLLLFIGSLNRINSSKHQNLRVNVWYPLVTLLIYSGGYLPVLVEERYIWPVYILLLLMGGYLLNVLFKMKLFDRLNNFWNLKIGNVLKAVLLLIFVYSFIIMPINSLNSDLNTGKDVYSLSNTLKNNYDIHGNIATNSNLTETQYLSFYLNTTCYGQTQENITDSELQPQLDGYNINYYLIWGNSAAHTLVGYNEITSGKLENLTIYAKN